MTSPRANAPRRGTLKGGAATWIHQRIHGAGCGGSWVLVGPSAWACEVPGVFSPRNDHERVQPAVSDEAEFYRVGDRGALGYFSTQRAEQQLPDAELQPGFYVGIVEERSIQDETYLRSTHDVWIARRDLIAVTPSKFEGIEIEPQTSFDHDRLPFGWVYVDQAKPRRTVGGADAAGVAMRRLTRVRVLEHRTHLDRRIWYRTADGWLSEQQLRVPSIATPPEGVGIAERWLDVDRRTQTLVAYVGATPVFATLVSTGRGPDDGPTATPSGTYRIWVKLSSTDMDNLDQPSATTETSEAVAPYAVEAVPFVMFFLRGYGLHATYWHDGFGIPKSHGCVNLSPRDAERIFEFTSPRLGPGWQAVHPDVYDPGTLIRVR